jgi:hypothetical protein
MGKATQLRYPKWQQALQQAILELDPDKLQERVVEAERVILDRVLEIQQAENGVDERIAIDDGLSLLRTLKRSRRG